MPLSSFGTAVAQNKLAATDTEVKFIAWKWLILCLVTVKTRSDFTFIISPPTHFDKFRLLRFTKRSSLYNCAILQVLFNIKFHKFSINLPGQKVTPFVLLYYDCYLKSDQMSHITSICHKTLKQFYTTGNEYDIFSHDFQFHLKYS
jgi:hypothetical protein